MVIVLINSWGTQVVYVTDVLQIVCLGNLLQKFQAPASNLCSRFDDRNCLVNCFGMLQVFPLGNFVQEGLSIQFVDFEALIHNWGTCIVDLCDMVQLMLLWNFLQ